MTQLASLYIRLSKLKFEVIVLQRNYLVIIRLFRFKMHLTNFEMYTNFSNKAVLELIQINIFSLRQAFDPTWSESLSRLGYSEKSFIIAPKKNLTPLQ